MHCGSNPPGALNNKGEREHVVQQVQPKILKQNFGRMHRPLAKTNRALN
jgi:hypothetical protein